MGWDTLRAQNLYRGSEFCKKNNIHIYCMVIIVPTTWHGSGINYQIIMEDHKDLNEF